MSSDLLPWALLVAFLVGSAVGIGATFYLTTVSAPWLHVSAPAPNGPWALCGKAFQGDRYLPDVSQRDAAAAMERARLCGANVCPRCLELVRRV